MWKNIFFTERFSARELQNECMNRLSYPIVFSGSSSYRIIDFKALTMEIALLKLFLHIQMYMMIPLNITQIIDVVILPSPPPSCPAHYEQWTIHLTLH